LTFLFFSFHSSKKKKEEHALLYVFYKDNFRFVLAPHYELAFNYISLFA